MSRPVGNSGREPRPEPNVDDKVAFLSRATSYPERPSRVETIETHMSWVFLTDRHAYKLKKPVRYAFLDFATVAARRAMCEEEVRLNRRLAPGVYLGVERLSIDDAGRLRLGGGGGATVDWLVRMRRLPAERMLDRAIASGRVREDEVRRLALLLARFYRESLPVPTDPMAYRERLAADARADHAELARPEYGLSRSIVDRVRSAQLSVLEAEKDLFDGRVKGGRIVEAHGDLRPEHVYLGPEPAVIDCLEFNRDLRVVDTADELSFFMLECEKLGADWVGDLVFEIYEDATGDRPPAPLIRFYKSRRASLRARLAILHVKEKVRRDGAEWIERARRYLTLAADPTAPRSLSRTPSR